MYNHTLDLLVISWAIAMKSVESYTFYFFIILQGCKRLDIAKTTASPRQPPAFVYTVHVLNKKTPKMSVNNEYVHCTCAEKKTPNYVLECLPSRKSVKS